MVKVNTSEAKTGGGSYFSEECDCIFMVENVDTTKAAGDSPSVVVESVSILSSVPDQVGKKIRQTFFLTGGSAGKIINLCSALGIYSLEQFKTDKDAGISPDLPIEESIGMLFGSQVRYEPMDAYNKDRALRKMQDHANAGEHDKAAKVQEMIDSGHGYLQIGGEKGFNFFGLGDKEVDHLVYDVATMSLANDKGEFRTRFGNMRLRGSASGPAASAAKTATKPKPAPTQTAKANPAQAAGGAVSSFF